MFKRIFICLLLVLGIGGSYAGYQWYQKRQTPQYATDRFIKALLADPEEAYHWLTPELQSNRESYWREYLADFTGKTASRMSDGLPLEDRFNTYNDTERPHRSLYIFDFDGKEYWLTIIMIRQSGEWKVDELFGSFRAS